MNLMITMVVGGLWHNPNQNYLIWGALNGLGLVFYNHWKKISPYENSNHWMVRVWKIFSTFTFMTIARIWFRVEGKRSEEHTSELQSRPHLVCRLLLETKKRH